MRKKKGAFGVVYQDVMRSPRLTPESKAIYAYLASMAGGDDECYPSRELMAKELNISVHRLDKHLSLLIASGVVKKKRMMVGNLKGRNIFKVTHEIEVMNEINAILGNIEKSTFRHDENRHDENNHDDSRHDENRHTNNNRLNNNRLNNNSINTLYASVPDDTAKTNRKKEANELFEQLWKAYPSKKGKAQVSDTAKARLLKIGHDEMMRAIDRYLHDFEKDSDWRKLQNGSTFFNSGYVDYLDANYKSAEDAQKESDHEKAKELERRCWGDIKPIEGNDLPFKYEG